MVSYMYVRMYIVVCVDMFVLLYQLYDCIGVCCIVVSDGICVEVLMMIGQNPVFVSRFVLLALITLFSSSFR